MQVISLELSCKPFIIDLHLNLPPIPNPTYVYFLFSEEKALKAPSAKKYLIFNLPYLEEDLEEGQQLTELITGVQYKSFGINHEL